MFLLMIINAIVMRYVKRNSWRIEQDGEEGNDSLR